MIPILRKACMCCRYLIFRVRQKQHRNGARQAERTVDEKIVGRWGSIFCFRLFVPLRCAFIPFGVPRFGFDVIRKKYDDGRQTEYQRLNEIAHIYQALNAANNWSGHISALLKNKRTNFANDVFEIVRTNQRKFDLSRKYPRSGVRLKQLSSQKINTGINKFNVSEIFNMIV